MSGFQSLARDAINKAAPTYATPVVSERGLSHFLDPNMTGVTRFLQKSGYPFALLTPQISAALTVDATAGAQSATVQGSRLTRWLVPGVVLSFELGDDVTLDSSTTNEDGSVTLVLSEPLASSHAAGTSVFIISFAVSVTGATPLGAGSRTGVAVEILSPFILVTGDKVTVDGTEYTLSSASEVSSSSLGFVYLIKTDSDDGFPVLESSTAVTVKARPVYRSDLLTVPQYDPRSLVRGPVIVDWVSGPIVSDYRPDVESTIYIEEFEATGTTLVSSREIARNDTLLKFRMERDQFLFWRVAEGSLNWNGTFTEVRANDNGRAHLWSACRPTLDPAPLATTQRTVPAFAPYQVLLMPGIITDSVTVKNAITGEVIPATDYVVDDVVGTVQFLAAYASQPVIVDYRPRMEWTILVTPDAANIEMCVKVGNEPLQTHLLGAANVPTTVTIPVTTAEDIDSIHITTRKADDSVGTFTVQLGDLQPRGGITSIIQYIIATDATRDFDWASSGLILKPVWPTLELLRARLDGESQLSRYLDNGRMLV